MQIDTNPHGATCPRLKDFPGWLKPWVSATSHTCTHKHKLQYCLYSMCLSNIPELINVWYSNSINIIKNVHTRTVRMPTIILGGKTKRLLWRRHPEIHSSNSLDHLLWKAVCSQLLQKVCVEAAFSFITAPTRQVCQQTCCGYFKCESCRAHHQIDNYCGLATSEYEGKTVRRFHACEKSSCLARLKAAVPIEIIN